MAAASKRAKNAESNSSLKLRKIGNSLGVVLPKEMVDELRIGEGDTLYATKTEDGLKLSPYDPEFEADIKAGRDFMRHNRDALRALAKR
ncbi:MAG: AbrB/MazE/SpoVT family DNA-binding domain-containing protein [Alphaproteobacteria bacterium]